MIPVRRLAVLLPLVAPAACAVGGDTSYVAPFSASSDAAVIAGGISAFLPMQLPAASTTLILEPTAMGQENNALTPLLADKLRQQGFAVAQAGAPAGAHTLSYWVTPLDGSGELVRLRIDSTKEASRFFVRDTTGVLKAGGPFTVQQMEASR